MKDIGKTFFLEFEDDHIIIGTRLKVKIKLKNCLSSTYDFTNFKVFRANTVKFFGRPKTHF